MTLRSGQGLCRRVQVHIVWGMTSVRAIRLPAMLAGLALVAAGCVSSEPPAVEFAPVTVPEVTTESDQASLPISGRVQTAIEEYWKARDTAFATGGEVGLAFMVQNNYPDLGYSVADCRQAWFNGTVPPDFAERNALLPNSIEPDPGWAMVSGPVMNQDLGRGVYQMVVAFTYDGQVLPVADRVSEVHLKVTREKVFHFYLCDEPDVIVATMPTRRPQATATSQPAARPTARPTTPVQPPAAQPPVAQVPTRPTVRPTTPDQPVRLPPITALPDPIQPANPANPPANPDPPTAVPPGSGIEFCEEGDPGAIEVPGGYYLCPVDPEGTDDDPGPSPSPSGSPSASPSTSPSTSPSASPSASPDAGAAAATPTAAARPAGTPSPAAPPPVSPKPQGGS